MAFWKVLDLPNYLIVTKGLENFDSESRDRLEKQMVEIVIDIIIDHDHIAPSRNLTSGKYFKEDIITIHINQNEAIIIELRDFVFVITKEDLKNKIYFSLRDLRVELGIN
jgi:hypothetical protein